TSVLPTITFSMLAIRRETCSANRVASRASGGVAAWPFKSGGKFLSTPASGDCIMLIRTACCVLFYRDFAGKKFIPQILHLRFQLLWRPVVFNFNERNIHRIRKLLLGFVRW